LSQEEPVFRRMGYFFDISPIHFITMGIIPQLLRNARKFFLYMAFK